MKLDKEQMLDEGQLDAVTGGNILETISDSNELYKRGLLDNVYEGCAAVRDKLHAMGYTGYKDNGGMQNDNVYTDKSGNTITREEFWKNFDKENGTKIIR